MAKSKVTKVEEIEEVETDEVEAPDTLTAKQVALMFGTDGRTLRKFLRLKRGRVGQGNRWAIPTDEVDDLRKEFEAFNKPKAPKEVKVLLAPADAEIDGDDDFDDLLAEEIEELDELEIG